jgi:hypothetical protein
MDLDGSVSGQGLFSFESGRPSQLLNVFSMAQLIYTHTHTNKSGRHNLLSGNNHKTAAMYTTATAAHFVYFVCCFFFFQFFLFFPVLFWSGPRPPGDFPPNRIIIRSNKQIKMDRCNTLPFNSNRTSYRESLFFGGCVTLAFFKIFGTGHIFIRPALVFYESKNIFKKE